MPNPPSPVPAELTPIVYGTTLLRGIPVKQDTRVVIERAYAGHPILISSDKDYVNLYHVYDRRNRRLPVDERRYLVRQQIGPSRWRLFMVRHRDDAPTLELERNYDPKRGRYIRYARQLAAGKQLFLHDKGEAIKARRAWQLYTPKAERLNLRSTIRSIPGKNPKYKVEILARTVR
jgi:hypothetical protein